MNKAACEIVRWICPLVVAALLLAASCVDVKHWGLRVKRERELELSAVLQPGSSFHARIVSGAISVQGIDGDECYVAAKVRAYAMDKEEAERLIEAIKVRLERSADGLDAVVEVPGSVDATEHSVAMTVSVPRRTSLKLTTGDGQVRLANIEGAIEATTANGKVVMENTSGDARLRSSEGAITCSQIDGGTLVLSSDGGDIRLSQVKVTSCNAEAKDGSIYVADVQADSLDLHTSDGGMRCQSITAARLNCSSSAGSVYITWGPEAPRSPDITIALAEGHITFVGASSMSVFLEAFTNSGPIRAQLPGAPKGRIGKSLRMTLGEGGGRLMLTTHEGSITIR